MGHRFIPFSAQDEPHWRVFSGVCPMHAGIIQIEVHLTGIGVREFPGFEINENEASQAAVEKHQVDAVPFISYTQALLTSHESKVIAEFEQEVLEVKNQRLFQR